MKKLIFLFLICFSLCATAQDTVKIAQYKVVSIEYDFGTVFEVSDNNGHIASTRIPEGVLLYFSRTLLVVLTTQQKIDVFHLAKKELPEWLILEAKIVRL